MNASSKLETSALAGALVMAGVTGSLTAADTASAASAKIADDLIESALNESGTASGLAIEASAGAAVAEGETAVAEKPVKTKTPKPPKEAKPPRITAQTHRLAGDRLVALLAGDKGFLCFSLKDADMKAEDLLAKQDAFIATMNERGKIADKVREKIIMLLTWLQAGKPVSDLNEVLLRSFKVLIADGKLTSGKDGNLQKNLLSKPYSSGTAASQANQMFMAFPILNITKREKGVMVANEDSTILAALTQMLK